MPLTDLPLADCRDYRSPPVPADFDAFWSRTLNATGDGPAQKPVFSEVDTGLTQIRTYDVTVPGFAGRPVRGRLRMAASRARRRTTAGGCSPTRRLRRGERIRPPSTCFTARNGCAGPTDVRVYACNGHEGGAEYRRREQLARVRDLFAGPPSGRTGHS